MTCLACGQDKLLADFYSPQHSVFYGPLCRDCARDWEEDIDRYVLTSQGEELLREADEVRQ
jgi:hypothetical protein